MNVLYIEHDGIFILLIIKTSPIPTLTSTLNRITRVPKYFPNLPKRAMQYFQSNGLITRNQKYET